MKSSPVPFSLNAAVIPEADSVMVWVSVHWEAVKGDVTSTGYCDL
jgi:hypothetical protein